MALAFAKDTLARFVAISKFRGEKRGKKKSLLL